MKAITTRWIPATNTKPTRIKARDGDGNSVTIGIPAYDADKSSDVDVHAVAAIQLMDKMEWDGELKGGWIGLPNADYAFVFVN